MVLHKEVQIFVGFCFENNNEDTIFDASFEDENDSKDIQNI